MKADEKNGLKTTEFWMAIVMTVAATILLLANKISDTQWMGLASGTSVVYTAARTYVKTK